MGTIALLTIISSVLIAASTPSRKWDAMFLPNESRDDLTTNYSPAVVATYWARRPVAVARRTTTVALSGLQVGVALLGDYLTGKSQKAHSYVLLTVGAPQASTLDLDCHFCLLVVLKMLTALCQICVLCKLMVVEAQLLFSPSPCSPCVVTGRGCSALHESTGYAQSRQQHHLHAC